MINMFQQIEVETSSGFLFSSTDVESGVMFQSSDYNIYPRFPTLEVKYLEEGQVKGPERTPYGTVSLYLTHNIRRISREYPTIMDACQNIGGSAEVLVFIFVYFMVVHHDIVMDLYMLNNAVLMNPKNLGPAPARQNQVTDSGLQKGKLEHQPYSYW